TDTAPLEPARRRARFRRSRHPRLLRRGGRKVPPRLEGRALAADADRAVLLLRRPGGTPARRRRRPRYQQAPRVPRALRPRRPGAALLRRSSPLRVPHLPARDATLVELSPLRRA